MQLLTATLAQLTSPSPPRVLRGAISDAKLATSPAAMATQLFPNIAVAKVSPIQAASKDLRGICGGGVSACVHA